MESQVALCLLILFELTFFLTQEMLTDLNEAGFTSKELEMHLTGKEDETAGPTDKALDWNLDATGEQTLSLTADNVGTDASFSQTCDNSSLPLVVSLILKIFALLYFLDLSSMKILAGWRIHRWEKLLSPFSCTPISMVGLQEGC